MALVPMSQYVFFLSQALAIAYVFVYAVMLLRRVRTGKVTPAMLQLPIAPYAMLGALECAAQVMGLAAASKLPGTVLPVLGQTFLVWQARVRPAHSLAPNTAAT